MPRKPLLDATVLQAALNGLTQQQLGIEKKIAALRAMLGAGKAKVGETPAGAMLRPKRTVSRATRKRMAAAQKRRWAFAKAQSGKKASTR
jgi:hypothetical protein